MPTSTGTTIFYLSISVLFINERKEPDGKGNTRVGTLRETFGENFAQGRRSDMEFDIWLEKRRVAPRCPITYGIRKNNRRQARH
jgi:hypothetical protein